MNPLQKRILDVLTSDVDKWEKAAQDVEAMIPKMPQPDREHWEDMAKTYRGRAEEYKKIVESLRAEHGA
jgi:hypothetical protein